MVCFVCWLVAGLGPGWHLLDLSVKAPNEPEVRFDVPPGGRWFDKREDDGQIERDLYPLGPDGRPAGKSCRYKVRDLTKRRRTKYTQSSEIQ